MPGPQRLGGGGVGQGRLERGLELAPGRLADLLPRLPGQLAGLAAEGGDDLLALPGQPAQLVAHGLRLGLAHDGAQVEEGGDLVGAAADEQVGQPGTGRRAASFLMAAASSRSRLDGPPGPGCPERR